MEGTTDKELKLVEKHKHQCRICKKRFRYGHELDEHMQEHGLNKGEATTGEPLCIPEFLTSNSKFERGACSSVVAAAGGDEPVDSSPPPPQWRSEEENLAHCLLELSNSGTGHAYVSNQNLLAHRKRYNCDRCDKSYQSYQALGGHRASHKRVKGCCAAEREIRSPSANNMQIEDQNNNPNNQNNMARPSPENTALLIVPLSQRPLPSRKYPQPHICRICNREFLTGQALGGHMGCHQIALKIIATAKTIAPTTTSVVNPTITTTEATTSAINPLITSEATTSAVNPTITTSVAASATATAISTDSEIGAISSEVNAIQPCPPTLPLLFKNSYRQLDLNVAQEPMDEMDGSSLQLWFSEVKSPQHGRDREPRRRKDRGYLSGMDGRRWFKLGIGSMSDEEDEDESEGH